MKNSGSYTIWLETAYTLFAEEGPQNLSINSLAKKCLLPRTNFYYYFDDKDDLIDKLIRLHFETTTVLFNEELRNRFHTYIPDLYVILLDFKLGLQFSTQLFRNSDKPKYNKAHKASVALSAEIILPKFKTFFKLDLPDKTVLSLWSTLVDAWYSRLNIDDLSVDSMISLCYEIMDSILPIVENKDQ